MAAKSFQFTKEFLTERCDYCGRCFAECPELRLPLPEAQAEIQNLVQSGCSKVLDLCTGCMACNTICPQNANPHTLIVNRWGAQYREKGLPDRARLVLPYQERNLHHIGMKALPEDEQRLVHLWEHNWHHPPQCDVMMYTGCNMLLLPFMLDSPLYADLPIFGSLDLCCGEPLYRMGCWDAAKAAARNVQSEFARMKLKKVVVPCLACYHLFNHVYPHILDVNLGIEILTLEDWISEQISSGKIRVSPLNKTVVLHDNCWPKASGDLLFQKVRELLNVLGVTVLEAPHKRENALCCGMCAGASRFRLRDIVRTAKHLLQELENSPAEWAVEYCGGCTWLLSLINQVLFSKYSKPRYHILEMVQLAAGETLKHRTDARMKSVIRAMAPRLMGSYLRGGRFWMDEIAGTPVNHQE
jgi:Fe-S oxidoreductase